MAQTQRQKIVSIALKYKGVLKGSPEHHELIDTFNKWKPDGYTAKYSDYWCAEALTAWIYLAGFTKLVRGSANVPMLVKKANADGIWHENENYKPKIGYICIYDWQDGSNYAKTDNKNSPDHVGLVIEVDSKEFVVIEGNTGSPSKVGTRRVAINGRYIRGFICPKYTEGEEEPAPKPATNESKINKRFKVVAKIGMNVREKPTTSSKKVGAINYGNTFKATKKSGNWVYSTYYKGWVCIKQGNSIYLKEVK